MASNLPGDSSQRIRHIADIHDSEEPDAYAQKWYFTAQEIEELSPSRKDGIKEEEESRLRKLYSKFLQELGMELKVPQVTIATSMMMCHRFYMRQSHAKNCWQTIATACMLLGCKVEETPRALSDVIVVAYKFIYKWDPSAPKRIKQKEVYDKQKELVINGERFLLATLAFNLEIEHPYKPLVKAIKGLDVSDNEFMKIAWNFVNDWLHTTLCLQYKPHYIAAGSIFLAAKIRKVKLPKEKGKVWWMQFDISPKYLEEVVQQMMRLLEKNKKHAQQPIGDKENAPKTSAEKIVKSSPESCTSSGAVASTVNAEGVNNSVPALLKCDQKQGACEVQDSMIVTIPPSSAVTEKVSSGGVQAGTASGSLVAHSPGVLPSMTSVVGPSGPVLSKCNTKEICSDAPQTLTETKVLCHASDFGSADSVVVECEGGPVKEKSDLNVSCEKASVEGNNSKIDLDRIRETIRKRKRDRVTNKKLVEDRVNEMDSEAWIERELENGISLEPTSTAKDK